VPHALIDKKVARMMTCLSFLQCYAAKEKKLSAHQVVTSDEEWVYHFTPISKQSNMQRKHSTEHK
jgi:transcriptional regulator of aromatic amino acid metabolism